MATAEDVYVQMLLPLGHGYPIWNPDPTPSSPEVHVGDVGHIEKGTFYRLFNAMKDADDPENEGCELPDNFEKLPIPEQVKIITPRAIQAGAICSKTVTARSVGAQVSGASGLAQGGFNIERHKEQGAVLILDDDADRTAVHANRWMREYMVKHYQNWDHLVRDRIGLDIDVDKLYFVRGVMKSKSWAIMTFDKAGSSYSGSVDVGYGPTGLALNMSWQDERHAPSQIRTGPRRSSSLSHRLAITDGSSVTSQSPYYDAPRNQSIFLNYYKIKRRRFFGPKVVRAAAEPRDPSSGASDSEDEHVVDIRLASGEVIQGEVVQEYPPRQPYDPVDAILDYILQHSHAEVAVSSDADVLALCAGGEIPNDISAFLRAASPRIEVEDNVGALDFLDEIDILADTSMALLDERRIASSGSVDAHSDDNEHDHDVSSRSPPAEEQLHVDSDKNPNVLLEEGLRPTIANDNQDGAPEVDPAMGPKTRDARTHNPNENAFDVMTIVFSKDSRHIAYIHDQNHITVWDTERQIELCRCHGHLGDVMCLAFSPTDYRLASGSHDTNAIIWNYLSGDQHAVLCHTAGIFDLAYSADGRTLATGDLDGVVHLWDAELGERHRSFPSAAGAITQLAFSPNDKYVLAQSLFSVNVWNAETGDLHAALNEHTGIIWQFAIDREGARVVTASEDTTARVWSLETGDTLFINHEHTSPVWIAQFSPDGERISTVSSDGTFVSCRVDGDQEGRVKLQLPHASQETTRISPDGRCVTSVGSPDGENPSAARKVTAWDTADGHDVFTLVGHQDVVTKVVFSPDCTCVATAGYDCTVRIWNPRDFQR